MEGSFERFARRARGEEPAGYRQAAAAAAGLPLGALTTADEASLWAAHRTAMGAVRRGTPSSPDAGEASLLDLKVELGQRLLGPCRLCWLRCPVDRRPGAPSPGTGACGLGAGLRPYQDFLHLGEELELIPTHAVYLAGCNYRCAYCSDWTHVDRPGQHAEVAPERLARSLEARREAGALSVSFIGGLPDVNLPAILQALQRTAASVPVVWNSNMSATPEAHDLLEGVVDAYVADLKYGSEACARAGSAVKGSLAVAQENLLRVAGEAYLVVRHLVLPGHVECCALPALDWLAEHLPGVRVNLMDQYRPVPEVAGTAWDRRPSAAELAPAREHAARLPLDLVGPGRVEPPPRPTRGRALPRAAAAGFDDRITIDPDGGVTIENLSPELAPLLQALGDLDPDLLERVRAGDGLG